MKEVKIEKVKSLLPKKIARIILWILLGFIMLRGIVSIARPSKDTDIYENLKKELEISQKQISINYEANSFAEGFVREFLDFKQGKNQEYKNNLSKYMGTNASTRISNSINSNVTVVETRAIKNNIISNNKFDIDVRAKVLYTTGVSKDIFLRVPVTTDGEKYLVEDLPLFIPEPSAADIKTKDITYNSAEGNISEGIKDMLNNFLRVYAEGQQGEIAYYLSDSNNKLGSLNGNFKFKDISELNVYLTEKTDQYVAVVNFNLEDQESKQEIKQRARFNIVFKDNKYYIEKFETRVAS